MIPYGSVPALIIVARWKGECKRCKAAFFHGQRVRKDMGGYSHLCCVPDEQACDAFINMIRERIYRKDNKK